MYSGPSICRSLIVLLPMLLVASSGAQEVANESNTAGADSSQAIADDFKITSYLGGSTLVGSLGVELQVGKTGYNIGILTGLVAIDAILCGGVKYYFKPHHHSWLVGVGGGIVLDKVSPDEDLCGPWSGDIPDEWVCETGSVIDMYCGGLLGYRWIWWDKLSLSIGAGPNVIKWQRIKEGSNAKYLPMFETVVGYTF